MRIKLSFLFSTIFFTIALFTLPHYGINWDTINHLPRGQAYLHYFLTGKKNYDDLEESPEYNWYWQNPKSLHIDTDIPFDEVPKRSMYQSYATDFNHFMLHDGEGHPPLSDILSSAFNRVLFGKLRIINDIDSYRVYGIFLASLLIALIFWWVSKYYGILAGTVSSLSLALYPLFWAESHFNTEKDIPETVYWSFLLFCIYKGVVKKSIRWILLSGIFFGLALGTKFNIFFSVFVIIPWLLFFYFKKYKKSFWLIMPSIIAVFIGFTIFIGTWPYLWQDPLGGILEVFGFYKNIGTTTQISQINTDPVYWILFTTPLIILLFSSIGIVKSIFNFKNDKNKLSLLFLLWLLVPILRVSLPGASTYGGVRQLMEYIPALAILSGIGISYLSNLLKTKISKLLLILFTTFNFSLLTFNLIKIHPYENTYFNSLIGGLKGAKEANIKYWGFSFGSPYRQGTAWINDNAEKNSNVVLNYELIPNIPRIWFRKDLVIHNSNRSGYLQKGEYAITLTYQGTDNRSYYDRFLNKFVEPVFEGIVDDVSVIKVWHNSPEHNKLEFNEEFTTDFETKKEENSLVFDLGEEKSLSRLELEYDESNCDPMTSGYTRTSKDGQNWITQPGSLPEFWRISALGEQPKDGKFIEPFTGQNARYIHIAIFPKTACLKNITSQKLYFFK